MWLSEDEAGFNEDCAKEIGNEKFRFRSDSPPFEGGESLCEFYLEHSEQGDKSKSLQYIRPSLDIREGFQNINLAAQSDVFQNVGDGKLSCRNFVSLLNKDLLPASTFTQTFLQSILSSVDSSDPVVANAWMETLLDVIDLLPKEIVKGEILTLAVNKGQMSQPVSSRLLCCKMLGKICLKFDPYVIKKEVLPVVLSLCQDVDFEVRGYMCRQLDVVAKGIGLEATKSVILPELVELANDEETFVRLAGIETIVQMLPLLDDDTCTQAIIPLVKKLCENSFNSKDSTLPVVSKQLGRLCCGLTENFSQEEKQWFLKYFQDLSKLGLPTQERNPSSVFDPLPDLLPEFHQKNRYRECRCACAYNFPAMVLFGGPENFERELYATFKDLCVDPFQNVRQRMACGFYEVTRLLNSNASLLQNELVTLLQDECVEVLKGLIPYLPECLKAICCSTTSQDNDKKDLVKALISCEEATSVTSSWRLHADFLSCLSCLPLCVSHETIFTTFVPLLFVKLHTARPIPCRTSAAYSLLIFLRNTPSLERRKGIINELIRELCYGRSCHKRMLFIRVCELVIELFSKVFFKLHFFKPLLTLSTDPVPNIRLCLCAILHRLKSLIRLPKDSHLLQELESSVKTLISNEKDRDVSHAVSKAIEELDKIEVAAEPISRRSSCIEIALDMNDRLKEDEERQQLEMEFNLKFIQDNKHLQPVTPGSPAKSEKIPVRKSGTLPKQSKVKEKQPDAIEKVSSSQTKSLRQFLLKRERRISSPALNVDVLKSPPQSSQILKDAASMQNQNSLSGKIPVRKSGTLPKQSKVKDQQPDAVEKMSSSQTKSLKQFILKKERRISSPVLNVDVLKNPPQSSQVLKDSAPVQNLNILKVSSPKCNIPSTGSHSPNNRTWPRQKRSSSLIPKQSNDRCPSPMPPPRRFSCISAQDLAKKLALEKKAASNNNVQEAKENKLIYFPKGERRVEVRRKTTGTILPSPELLRRSATFTNLSNESKIPTSKSKKQPTKEN